MTGASIRIVTNGSIESSGQRTVQPYVLDITPDGIISYSGTLREAPPETGRTVHAGGLAMPGLVNWHSHAPMTILDGLVGMPGRREWLRDVWELEARLTAEDVFTGALVAFGEMARHGITASVEMYFHDRALIAAAEAAGFRCCVTPGVNETPGFVRRFGGWQTQLRAALAAGDSVSDGSVVTWGLSVHSPYCVSEHTFREVASAARHLRRPLHLHLAELSAPEELDGWGYAGFSAAMRPVGSDYANVIAAHGVNLTARDWMQLRDWDWRVALCPRSNAVLGLGLPQVPEPCRDSIVRFGTDGAPVAPLDVLASAAPLAASQRAPGPEAAWSRASVLRSCFAPSDDRLGGPAQPPIGRLAPGYAADLVIVSPGPWQRAAEPGTALRAGDYVTDVWIAGRRVVAGGEIVAFDLKAAYEDLFRIRERLRPAN